MVIKTSRRTVTIDRTGVVEKVGIDRVTPAAVPSYISREAKLIVGRKTEHVAEILRREPAAASSQEEATEEFQPSDEEEYLVERLLSFHKDEKLEGLEWLEVKWAGYVEPTWTQRENIPEELVSRFFRKRKNSRGS